MRTTLAEICAITMGQAPAGESYNESGEGIPLIAGAGDFRGIRPAPKKFTTQPSKVSAAGDIVLSIRASIGAKIWADGQYCLGRGVVGLRPDPTLSPLYLWHWLSHSERTLAAKGRGATFLQVNRTDIGEMSIDLPPLGEQERIAAILDHANALRAKRRQVLAHLDALTQSIFYDMFGDPLSQTSATARSPIGSVAKVVTGNSPPRSDSTNFGDAMEWIKSDNLGGDIASQAKERLSERGMSRARVAPAGSILVTCIAGSPASIGKASMADRDVAFNQQINAVLPSPNLDMTFLMAQFKVSPKLVRLKSSGGMKGLVSKSAFESIKILLPPLKDQQQFTGYANQVEAHRLTAQRSLTAADELFASLQTRAFKGEL